MINAAAVAMFRQFNFMPPAEIVRATDASKMDKMSNEPIAML